MDGPRTAGSGLSSGIVIEDGVWIGATSSILAGVTVGQKSMIAAGAVVTRDIPHRTLVGGVPAKSIRSLKITS